MKAVTSLLDFRDDMYVTLYRRWLIVEQLGRNRNEHPVLTFQKAALFDYLLKNPRDLHDFLVAFKRLNDNSPYANVLYHNDAEYGSYLDVPDFVQSILVLESQQYVATSVVDSEYFVFLGEKTMTINSSLADDWRLSLSLLKPLVSKSLNSLLHYAVR